MCNSTMHVSSMEKNIVESCQSLSPLYLGFRGVFLGLEGVLEAELDMVHGDWGRNGPSKERGRLCHGPAGRSDILGLPLLSQMIRMMDFYSRNQNEPLSKTTVCARTFPCTTIRRTGCNLGTQVPMPPLAVGSSGSTGDGQSTSPF